MQIVPKTPIKNRVDRLDGIAQGMIGYMELLKAALVMLQSQKRGTPPLHFKLQIEIAQLAGLLRNLFQLDVGYLTRVVTEIHQDPDFEKGVKEFVDGMAPEAPLLITPDDLLRGKAGKFQVLGG